MKFVIRYLYIKLQAINMNNGDKATKKIENGVLIMKDRITIDVIVNKEKVSKQDIMQWLSLTNYFNPTDMKCRKLTRGKFRKYNKKKFYENLANELMETNNSIEICDDNNNVWIYKNYDSEKNMSLSCLLEKSIFEKNMNFIYLTIEQFIIQNKGILAYACSLSDLA